MNELKKEVRTVRKALQNSIICAIFGTIITVLGAVTVISGYNMHNNFAARTKFYLTYGREDKSGAVIMAVGAIVVILGVILLGLSLYFRRMSRRKFDDVVRRRDYEGTDAVIEQMAGTKTIFDIFHSEDRSRTFSFYRNKTCILKDGDTVWRGRMKALEWAAGHPTLWRITMDIEGEEQILEIAKTEGNIVVKKEDGTQEIYYRN